jgi:hypothetical protein
MSRYTQKIWTMPHVATSWFAARVYDIDATKSAIAFEGSGIYG